MMEQSDLERRRREIHARGLMPRNEDVAKEVNKITGTDSPLMQQAQTDGLKMANRRGLMNSSMAVGAAQNEALRAALPMAQQTAGQNFQTNRQQSDQMQQRMLQENDINSRETMQRREFRQQTGLQGNDISARERMQGRELEQQTGLQANDIAARQEAQRRELRFNSQAQERDLASRQDMAGLDRALQERLATWNLDAAERQQASGMLTSMQQVHAAQVQSIMANTAMDAGARQNQLNALNEQNARRINLVEQMFGVQIQWGAPDTPTSAATRPSTFDQTAGQQASVDYLRRIISNPTRSQADKDAAASELIRRGLGV